jgi:hypothetical protein
MRCRIFSPLLPAHRSPASPLTHLAPRVCPSPCQEKGQATGCTVRMSHYSWKSLRNRCSIQPEETTGIGFRNSQPCNKERIMRCTRCAGLRVPEIICEGGSRVSALRCVHCGDVIDRVIAFNRQRRRHPKANRSRTPIFGIDPWKKNKPTLV